MRKNFAVLLLGAVTQVTGQTILFQEDFESYANNAAILASAKWSDLTLTGAGAGLSTDQNATPSGSKSIKEPVGNTGLLSGVLTGVTPTDAEPVTVEFSFFDNASVTTPRTRSGMSFGAYSGGIWGNGTLQNYAGFGVYGSANTTYDVRVVSDGAGGSWILGTGAAATRVSGWRRLKIVLNATTATFFVDDVQVGQRPVPAQPAAGWNSFRLGPFTGSPAFDIYYDDILITQATSHVEDWTAYH